MAAKGQFNIFNTNWQQPDKNFAVNLFSTVTQTNQNNISEITQKETVTRRDNFTNQIRKKHKQQVKKNIRQQLMKQLEDNNFLNRLQSMAHKNNFESNNLCDFLSDLKRSMNDYSFCKKLDQKGQIKQFLLDLFIKNKENFGFQQKSLLIHSLIFLTYYGSCSLQHSQKQKLNQTMIQQLLSIKDWNFQSMEYFKNMLDLLTNITADQDQNTNYYLMDTNIFPLISTKITEISNQAGKIKEEEKNHELYEKYIEEINEIQSSLIGTICNLSTYQSTFFFEYAINQFVNDINYLKLFPSRVVRIFTNFFHYPSFRQNFIENPDLVLWFQKFIPVRCQQKFENLQEKKTGKFENIILSRQEKETFYQFLQFWMIWIYKEQDDAFLESIKSLISFNLNLYCLSQYLIQSAGFTDKEISTKKNSKYVCKAIQMYQYLASDPKITTQELLVVTSERNPEDILKVFLEKTYFTSCKISDITISFLNKILSKDNKMLNVFVQLRIFQSIDAFLSGDMQIQTRQQIINFFDLLILMIATNDEESKNKSKPNQIARLLQINGFIKNIQRYQQHKQKKVANKVEAFLNYFDTVREGCQRNDSIEI